MDKDIKCLEIELAKVIEENQEREAQAVKGYTTQLALIDELIEVSAHDPKRVKEIAFLEVLRQETEEKISDELNHQQGLLMEYVEFTGIQIKKD